MSVRGHRASRAGSKIAKPSVVDLQAARDARKSAEAQTDAHSQPGGIVHLCNSIPAAANRVLHANLKHPNPAGDPIGEHLEDCERLTAMELRRKYPLTANTHRRIIQDRKNGRCTVAAEFVDFRGFLQHVGPRPAKHYTLDRKDTHNRHYGPGLVEWRDKTEQANNRPATIYLNYKGQMLPLTTVADLTGQKPDTLRARRAQGWSDEEVIGGRAPATRRATVHSRTLLWPDKADEWEWRFQNSGTSLCRLAWWKDYVDGQLRCVNRRLPEWFGPDEDLYADPDTARLLRVQERLARMTRKVEDLYEQSRRGALPLWWLEKPRGWEAG